MSLFEVFPTLLTDAMLVAVAVAVAANDDDGIDIPCAELPTALSAADTRVWLLVASSLLPLLLEMMPAFVPTLTEPTVLLPDALSTCLDGSRVKGWGAAAAANLYASGVKPTLRIICARLTFFSSNAVWQESGSITRRARGMMRCSRAPVDRQAGVSSCCVPAGVCHACLMS